MNNKYEIPQDEQEYEKFVSEKISQAEIDVADGRVCAPEEVYRVVLEEIIKADKESRCAA